MKEHLNKYVSVLIVLVVLILLYIGSVVLKKNTTNAPTVPEQEQSQNQEEPTGEQSSSESQFRYEYVANYKDNGGLTEQNYDGRIVKIDIKTNKATTVIPSVKEAYPKLKDGITHTVSKLTYSTAKGYLYLTTIFAESDGGYNGILRFDPMTSKLTELKISGYYRTMSGTSSETSPYAVSILKPTENDTAVPRTLYLLDLDNDIVKTIATLPNNQTFNYCYKGNCLFGIMPTIEWLNGEEVEIGIYSTTQTEKDEFGNIVAKLVQKKRFNVNQ